MNSNENNVVCSICKVTAAIYRCPGCMTRTCSLKCCLVHKEESGCNGKRNRVEFVPLHQYSDSTLSSDFHFLEDVLAKSERGKRLIKDIGATVRNHSSSHKSSNHKKRRKIEDVSKGKSNNDDEYRGEQNHDTNSMMPIQPLLRLKVDEDGGGKTSQENEIKLNVHSSNNSPTKKHEDSSCHNVTSQHNPMRRENSNGGVIRSMKLSEEEESRLTRYPPHKQKLVRQAHQRGITLLLMAPGMQRHIVNKSTKYDSKRDVIYWKVEFILHLFARSNEGTDTPSQSSKLTLTADRVPETESISMHLSKLIERNTSHSAPASTRSTLLQFCCSANTKLMKDNVCSLLKRIPCKSSQPSYRKLDLNHCLSDMLKGATVIEFPTIEIVLQEDLHHFPIFISEM